METGAWPVVEPALSRNVRVSVQFATTHVSDLDSWIALQMQFAVDVAHLHAL